MNRATNIETGAASGGVDLEELAWRGIELCRRGDWQEGVYWLGQVTEAEASGTEEIPGLFYAYLGYGMARYHDRRKQGLELCRRAIEMDRYQPESYDFLARLHLLMGDRRSAFQVVERGLEIDAANSRLLEIREELGERRSPVLPFLGRRHPFNRYLGRVRHRLLGPGARAGRQAAESGRDGAAAGRPSRPSGGASGRGGSGLRSVL